MKQHHTLNDLDAKHMRDALRRTEVFIREHLPKLLPKESIEHLDMAGRDIVLETAQRALTTTVDAYAGLDQYMEDIASGKEQTDAEKREKLLAEMYALNTQLAEVKRELEEIDERNDRWTLMFAAIRRERQEASQSSDKKDGEP